MRMSSGLLEPLHLKGVGPDAAGITMQIGTLQGVFHRDLKLENTLIDRQPNSAPRLKICDFGYSKVLCLTCGAWPTQQYNLEVAFPGAGSAVALLLVLTQRCICCAAACGERLTAKEREGHHRLFGAGSRPLQLQQGQVCVATGPCWLLLRPVSHMCHISVT